MKNEWTNPDIKQLSIISTNETEWNPNHIPCSTNPNIRFRWSCSCGLIFDTFDELMEHCKTLVDHDHHAWDRVS